MIFDKEIADNYDDWYEQPLGDTADKVEKDIVFDMLEPTPGESALDLGCGTGNYLFELEELGLDLVGIDISEPMLEKAEEKISGSDSEIELIRGDIQNLPFEDRTFRLVLSVATFEFLGSPREAAKEAWRVLKPGGKLVIGVISKGSSWAEAYEEKSSQADNPFDEAEFYGPRKLRNLLPYSIEEFREGLFFDADDSEKSRSELMEKEDKNQKGEKRGGFICAKWSK